MGPKKLKGLFTDEIDFTLIQLVERRPLLWDSTIELYRRADLKRSVWAEVASVLGPEFSAELVMTRWKSIKETFQDNLNRVKESKRRSSGNGADDGYRPRWKLWPSVQFLTKTCAMTDSVSNISMTSEISHSSEQSTENCSNNLSVYYDENVNKFMMVPSDESVFSSEIDLSDPSIISTTSPSPAQSVSALYVQPGPSSAPEVVPLSAFSLPRPSSAPSATASNVEGDSGKNASSCASGDLFTKRGSAKRKSASAVEEALKIVKEMAKEPETPIPQSDAVDHFVSFVASRLRSLDSMSRKSCEDQLMTVLMKF